jgi:hypothetical protein
MIDNIRNRNDNDIKYEVYRSDDKYDDIDYELNDKVIKNETKQTKWYMLVFT